MIQRKEFLVNALDLVALGCLAVSQPIFDLLTKNTGFLAARNTDATDLVLMIVTVTFTVPVTLSFIELIACLIGKEACEQIHRVMIWLLVVLLLLPPFKPLYSRIGPWWIIGALLAGGIISETYVRLRSRGIALAYLSPLALILPSLFVFDSPVRSIVRPAPRAASAYPRVNATAPVVMVIFDELPLVSLMDGRGLIDPVLYPNFAALARQATWYRNASTITDGTLHSVPAILDGLMPDLDSGRLPDARGHPNTLFTLLGGSYGMNVVENNTRLCPEGLCAPSNTGATRAERLYSFFSDLGVLYAYILLPSGLTRSLPDITLSWNSFRFAQAKPRPAAEAGDDFDRWTSWDNRSKVFTDFVDTIQPRSRPTMNFLHVLLPHAPWEFLPSGKRYTLPEDGIRGLVGINDRGVDPYLWADDPWALEQAYQRHLLQVGMVDRLVGQLIEHLRRVKLFDACLLVITADHGASFRPHTSRRTPSLNNCEDIAAVPLFIKAPDQKTGEVTDRNIESIDILPTMADILRIPLPWRTDGRSALNLSVPARARKTLISGTGEKFSLDARLGGIYESVANKVAWFGSEPEGLFHIGPHRELLGRDVSSLRTARYGVGCDLTGRNYYENVDPNSDFVLTNVCGRLTRGRQQASQPLNLAVAVNGKIRGLTQSYLDRDGGERFSSVLSDEYFHPGYNRVVIYLIEETGGGFELAETESSGIPPYHWGDVLHFDLDGNARVYQAGGWSEPEKHITWTDGGRSDLVLPTAPPRNPVRLKFHARAYVIPGQVNRQKLRILVNRRLAAELELTEPGFRIREILIPREFFDGQNRTAITLETPDSAAPNVIGDGNDLRKLGIALAWLSLSE